MRSGITLNFSEKLNYTRTWYHREKKNSLCTVIETLPLKIISGTVQLTV